MIVGLGSFVEMVGLQQHRREPVLCLGDLFCESHTRFNLLGLPQ